MRRAHRRIAQIDQSGRTDHSADLPEGYSLNPSDDTHPFDALNCRRFQPWHRCCNRSKGIHHYSFSGGATHMTKQAGIYLAIAGALLIGLLTPGVSQATLIGICGPLTVEPQQLGFCQKTLTISGSSLT